MRADKRYTVITRNADGDKAVRRQLQQAKHQIDILNQELQDAYKELKETQDALVQHEQMSATGELAYGIAHEIRNPLSIINMAIQYLQSKLAPEDPLREFTLAIIEKVKRLDRMTKELVQYGKPLDLELKPVDIQALIEANLKIALPRCKAQGVEVCRNFYPDFPGVQVDIEKIDEVLCNLITNALDAMPKGGILAVATQRFAGSLQILIGNTGKGVLPRHREKLFTPFFTTKADGTGLGLAICQRIMHRHGGNIKVESKISGKNKGTRITLILPYQNVELSTKVPGILAEGTAAKLV